MGNECVAAAAERRQASLMAIAVAMTMAAAAASAAVIPTTGPAQEMSSHETRQNRMY